MVYRDWDIPVILHIPHSSHTIPDDLRDSITVDDAELNAELLRITDAYTEDLFRLPGSARVVHPVSRLIVDPERFENDEQEPMTSVGMGVIYTRTTTGEKLREQPFPEDRDQLLDKYYAPHHTMLNVLAKEMISAVGRCLVIDCHSFPSEALPYELDKESERLDICIGTDDFHTDDKLRKKAEECFREKGYTVSHNRPFSGSLVPSEFYRTDHRVQSTMIELNRGLYMNESNGERSQGYKRLREELAEILQELSQADASDIWR